MRKILTVTLVGAAGAAVAWQALPTSVPSVAAVRGHAVDAVFATVSVEPRTRMQVRAAVAGHVADISVKEGEQVRSGQALVRLAAPHLQAEVERQQAERDASLQQAASSAPAIAALEARAAAIQARLDRARFEESRTAELVAQHALPEAALVRDRAARATLDAELTSTRAETRALRLETRGRADVMSAQLRVATWRLRDTELHAVADATVLERLVNVGDDVVPGQALLRLADTTRLHLRCVVDETDALRVRVGQTAAISLGAVPDRSLRGVVRQVRPEAEPDGHSVVAEVELLEAPAGLRPGFTGDANIIVAERSAALLVPARAVDQASQVWLVREGRAVPRRVQVGIRSLEAVEVLSGLSEGERVLVDSPRPLVEGLRVRATPIVGGAAR